MGYTPDLATGVWMGNADNTPMAPGTFSSAGSGPIWRRFMNEAHAYLQLPAKPFEKPANINTSSCGGREEVFKDGAQLPEPGACKAPPPKTAPGGPTPVPTPKSPTFPPKNTPTPPPTPAPSAPPSATPAPTLVFLEYTVQDGDTVQSIANDFGITEQELRDANGFSPGHKVDPGDVILIPLPPGDLPTSTPPPSPL
jgi:LysM repeat protein